MHPTKAKLAAAAAFFFFKKGGGRKCGMWLWTFDGTPQKRDWEAYAKICRYARLPYIVGPKICNGSMWQKLPAGDRMSAGLFAEFAAAVPSTCIPWSYLYGTDPAAEAQATVDKLKAIEDKTGRRIPGLIINVENFADKSLKWWTEKGQKSTFVTGHLTAAGVFGDIVGDFLAGGPVFGISSYAITTWHPEIPYAVWGQSINTWMPQSYWCTDRSGKQKVRVPAWWTTDRKAEWEAIMPGVAQVPTCPAYFHKDRNLGYCKIRGSKPEIIEVSRDFPNINLWQWDGIAAPGQSDPDKGNSNIWDAARVINA